MPALVRPGGLLFRLLGLGRDSLAQLVVGPLLVRVGLVHMVAKYLDEPSVVLSGDQLIAPAADGAHGRAL